MRGFLAMAAAALVGFSASATPAEPDGATKLRCAAAFMITRDEQARGIDAMKACPAMEPRGRLYYEYVVTGEMIDRLIDHRAAAALVEQQTEQLQKEAIDSADPAEFVDGVMKKCLPILDAKFPPQ